MVLFPPTLACSNLSPPTHQLARQPPLQLAGWQRREGGEGGGVCFDKDTTRDSLPFAVGELVACEQRSSNCWPTGWLTGWLAYWIVATI